MARWVIVFIALVVALLGPAECAAQTGQLSGQVRYGAMGIPYAQIYSMTDGSYTFSDANGNYSLILPTYVHHLLVYAPGFQLLEAEVAVSGGGVTTYDFVLVPEVLSGAVQGTVWDSQTGLPVALATVSIPAQGLFATAGFDGYYWLEVPAGTFDLVVDAAGHISKTVPGVVLAAGEVLWLDIDLTSAGGDDDHCDDPAPCATPLEINGAGTAGTIETPGDMDCFQWHALAGVTYEIETSELGPGADTVLSLYKEDGTTLFASNDDSGVGYASKIVWTADQTELMYLRVNHFSPSGTGTYRVAVKGSDDHCNEPGPCATELVRNGNAISGKIDVAGDVDWFRFTATSGLTFEVETLQLGPDSDTVMFLYRSDGTTLIASDDDGGEGSASRIAWVADTQDPVYVMVRQYNSSATGSYRIRVKANDDHCDTPGSCATLLLPYGATVDGEFEIDEDQDWFRFQALPGVFYVIETSNLSEDCDTHIYLVATDGQTPLGFNDDWGSLASRIEWLADAGGVFYVLVKHYDPQGRGTYDISLTGSDDHGDVPAWASELAAFGDPLPGYMEKSDYYYDVDLFWFLAEAGRRYTIETFNLGQGCDTYLELYDQSYNFLTYNDDIISGTLASRIEYTIPVSGIYYVAAFVSPYASWGSGTYEIRILADDDYPNPPGEDAHLLQTDGTEVSGRFESAGDEDWFRFEVEAGLRYVVETLSLGAGCDTVLEIYDSDGVTLLASDDDGGGGMASRLEGLIAFSRTLFIRLSHYSPSGTGTYGIRIVAITPDDHGDIPSAGTLIHADGTTTSGQISAAGDVDWFQFEALEGVTYVIETSCLDDTCDTVMELYGTDGSTLIAENDDGGEGLGSLIRWSAGASGTHYVAVRHFSPEDTGAYQISLGQEDAACTPIQAGQTVNGNLSQAGEGRMYCLPVSGGTQIGVFLQGPAFGADFDLYVRWNAPPGLSEYDDRGFSDTSREQCEATVTSSGTLYIWVRSYAGGGDYTLRTEENPYQPACDFTLTEGIPQAGSLNGPGDGKLYCLEVEDGDQVLMTLVGPMGSDFDLYLKYGAPPTLTNYDTRAYTAFPQETAALQNLSAGTLFVWVVSYSGSGEYSLDAYVSSTQAGCMRLVDGVPQTDYLSFTYDQQLYCLDVDAGDQITVTLAGPASGADFDLFLKFGVPPALDDWDAAARSSTSSEQIQFTATSGGTLYISVWSYSGIGEYTIQASVGGRQSLGLITKLSQTPGQEVLFMKGSIKDSATGEALQPSRFCITVKNVGKFCYQPGSGEASQVSFVPGGYFFLILPQAQNLLTCEMSDVPCYQSVEKNFTIQQLSDAVFDVSLDPATDCDGDGMACGWEKRYGLNIWKNDAPLDLDQDAYTNLEEYNAGTNPDDKDSIPLLVKSVVAGDINGDRRVGLADAVMAFQVVGGMNPAGVRVGGDVNGDGKIGMAEAVYALQAVSGLR